MLRWSPGGGTVGTGPLDPRSGTVRRARVPATDALTGMARSAPSTVTFSVIIGQQTVDPA